MAGQLPKKFKTLFWDFDYQKVDLKKHRRFIIERLLERGRMEHVIWIYENYDREFIQTVINSSSNLSSKTRNFWLKLFNR